ncbi:DUF4118 domain-containing protein [Sphingomonas sp. SRS2]|uniref:DUF4118 domain-containing protein n=1 Tax=Sphingomonas sp. SRS2 TaxID=133190 RepID=UPI0006184D44|nr:DUF4118 domain-containing protein [Sphingomonas sp. SRS2]KKC24063.1 hypothetical protein WP12_21395 [Sphingomonas sp. SRS2]
MDERDYPPAVKTPAFGRWSIAAALLLVGAATGTGVLLGGWLSLASIAFLLLMPVIVMADRGGLWSGLAAAMLALFCLNFFFIPPTFTLQVARADNIVTLAVFIGVAMTVSSLADRRRHQARLSARIAMESELLAALSQQLAHLSDPALIREHLRERLGRWTGGDVRFLTSADLDEGAVVEPIDQAAARWAIEHGDAAGKGSAIMPGAEACYLPFRILKDEIWLAQFWSGGIAPPVPTERTNFVRQALDRGGDALHRALLAARQADIEARQQHDALRETLLASISHDLRTPLTTVRAALGTIRSDDRGALDSAKQEADRLDRMIGNLLDLARLRTDGGAVENLPVDLTDAVDAALDALRAMLSGRPLSIDIDDDLPLVLADARMLHHMLINLIENACKYSPDGSAIDIAARREGHRVTLSVGDHGNGIPASDPSELFASFRRGADSDRVPGSGLGLAVVAGFAAAMHLRVDAANRSPAGGPGGGAIFAIHFPETATC